MKKLLLTLIVTMLTYIGAWAQGELVGEEWYKPTDAVSFNNVWSASSSAFKVEENDDLLSGLGVGDQLVVYYHPIAAGTAQLYLKNSSNNSYQNGSWTDPFSIYENVSNTDLTYKSMTVDSKLVSEFVTGGLYFTGDNVVAEQIRIIKAGETPGGEEPGDDTPTNNFGTASSWSYADGTLTIDLNASSDLQESNWGYGQTCPWASEIGNISKVVLNPAADVTFNSNVLYIFFEGKAASTLVLSNLTAEQVDQLKSSQNLDKIYNNRSKISLKLPEGYEYDSAAEPWSHYTVTGGTNTNGSGGGSGSGGGEGGDPEPGPAPSVVTTGHVTYTTTLAANDVATINLAACGGDCTHTTLAGILSDASISTDDAFAKVIIKGAATDDFEAQIANLNTKALVLADVTGLTVSSTLSNSYVKNLVLPNGLHKDVVTAENLAGFTNLESAASVESLSETKTTDHYYYTPDGGSKTEFTGVVVDKGEGVYEGTVTEHPTVELNHVSTVNTYVNNYYKNEVTEIAEEATAESDVYVDGGVAKVNRQKVFLDNQKIEYYKDEALSQREYNTYVETEEGDNYGKRYYWNGSEKVYEVYVKYIYQDPENNYAFTQYSGDVVPVGDDFYGYLEYDPAKEYALTTKYNYTYKFNPTDEEEEAKPISFNEPKTQAQVNRDVTYTLTKETVDDPVDLGQSLVAYVKEEGHLAHTLQHVPAFSPAYTAYEYWYTSPNYGYSYNTSKVKRITLAGNLNAWDLNKQYNYHVTADGHYTSTEAKDYSAFTGSLLISHLDLENAVFANQDDMVLNAYGLFDMEPGYEQFITLPNSPLMTKIPAHSLQNLRGVKTLCIPYHYTVIETEALKNSDISHIYTTSPQTQDVEGVHYEKDAPLDLGPTSWTLPPFLTKIETGAFWTRVTGGVSDVYIYNPVPPLCEKDAFPKGMYTGWGGFAGNDSHPIRRENYKNNEFLFTILHFPAGLSDADRGKYTDITRKYSFMDETGATDDDGNIFMWPAMNQFYRAYDQAVAGVIWDAWIPSHDPNDYSDATGWDPVVTYDEFTAARSGTEAKINPTYGTSYSNLASTVQYEYEKYMGWHQFVLVGSTNYQKETGNEKYWNFSSFKENDWYTICVPFDLKKSDLQRIFGAKAHAAVNYTQDEIDAAVAIINADGYVEGTNPDAENVAKKTASDVKIPAVLEDKFPDVRSLAGVTRDNNNLHIFLQLSDDLMNAPLEYESDGRVKTIVATSGSDKGKIVPVYGEYTDDDPVVIYHDHPYYIKPVIPSHELDIANAGARVLTYDPFIYENNEYSAPDLSTYVYATTGDQKQFINQNDESAGTNVSNASYKYYFIGNYIKQYMPQWTYYVGRSTSTNPDGTRIHKMFRNTSATRVWNPYTAVVGGVANTGHAQYQGGDKVANVGVTNKLVDFLADQDYTFNYSSPAPLEAKSFGFMLTLKSEFDEEEDENVTGIMVPNEGGSMTFVRNNAPVYNVSGQLVGNSLEGLSKGVYIVSGKKYVVK